MTRGIDHHWYGVVVSCRHPANTSDKRSCLQPTVPDTNSAVLASNTIVANVDILRLRREVTASLNPDRDVVASAGVVLEREPANCRVTNAIDIARERCFTISGTAAAGRVGEKRESTSGRIGASRRVMRERCGADGCIGVAASV